MDSKTGRDNLLEKMENPGPVPSQDGYELRRVCDNGELWPQSVLQPMINRVLATGEAKAVIAEEYTVVRHRLYRPLRVREILKEERSVMRIVKVEDGN